MASVVDKRFLRDGTTHDMLHMMAYEFLLKRVQHYMRQYRPKHRALIVMDDTSRQLNRAVTMKHALFQRTDNRNMAFPAIVEYPFFTRSELSNGVQLADLIAYSVYRAFKGEGIGYPYFEKVLGNFYVRRQGTSLDGLKVWPDRSPLSALAAKSGSHANENPITGSDVRLGEPYRAYQGHPTKNMWQLDAPVSTSGFLNRPNHRNCPQRSPEACERRQRRGSSFLAGLAGGINRTIEMKRVQCCRMHSSLAHGLPDTRPSLPHRAALCRRRCPKP